jgi:hypothetical protein
MSRHLSIADLARIICPRGAKHRVMTLLRAYCDASFTDANRLPGWTAIAGYVGTEETWTEVEGHWAEKKKFWGLDEFSVAKILAGRTAVGFADAERCVRSFGSIIRESDLEGVSAAINDQHWASQPRSERFPNKYHTCLSMLFHILDEHMRLQFQGDMVAIFLDTDHAPDAALESLCKEWRTESKVIATVTFGRRSQFPVLECADLCAGTERKAQLAGGWPKTVRGDEWYSTSFAKRHRGTFWSAETEKQIEEALKQIEERKRRQREVEG